jgi:hypothetical protein
VGVSCGRRFLCAGGMGCLASLLPSRCSSTAVTIRHAKIPSGIKWLTLSRTFGATKHPPLRCSTNGTDCGLSCLLLSCTALDSCRRGSGTPFLCSLLSPRGLELRECRFMTPTVRIQELGGVPSSSTKKSAQDRRRLCTQGCDAREKRFEGSCGGGGGWCARNALTHQARVL